ncbi:MAG: S8 family serine peptidase [Blastocatellales bacterium]|nr:S8 family serine peptidase [Blastocatellales bacterium]
MRRLLSGLFVLISLLNSSPQSGSSASEKISPRLFNHATHGETVEFIVVMTERADLRAAYAMPDKTSRGAFAYNALRAAAETSQASIRNWLVERGIEHRAFYIVNALWVRAPREAVLEIAARRDVLRIDANPQIRALPLRDLEPMSDRAIQRMENTRLARSAAAVEPGLTFIKAPEVWAMGYTGQGIVIGGADTGVQWDHPALKEQYRGWNGTSADHDYNWHDSIHTGTGNPCGIDTTAPCDDNNHGTHTVGTAVGDDGAGNQIGVAPGAKFIACRNMDRGTGTPARYIECMEFFLAPYPTGGSPEQGDPARAPDITINSWTCPQSEGCEPETLRAAVEAQRAAGIMMVVAAGNEGPNCSSIGWPAPGGSPFSGPPSHYAAAYTVGAVSSSTGTITGFSSRGPVIVDGSNRVKPDITAPGLGIRSAVRTNGYSLLSGTSMAAPHVAGAVALLWSAAPHLRRDMDLTEAILNSTAAPVETALCSSSGIPNNVYGYGHLNIKAAVEATMSFSAGGRVVSGGGDGIERVAIEFSVISGAGAAPAAVLTDGDGNWSQSGFEPGRIYRARAVQVRQIFNPGWRDFSAANDALDFSRIERRVIVQ